jgi:hypothetical protein
METMFKHSPYKFKIHLKRVNEDRFDDKKEELKEDKIEDKSNTKWNDRVDADTYDVEWSVDEDYAHDQLSDVSMDYNEDDLSDFIERVSIG